jgi:hypothetical protein
MADKKNYKIQFEGHCVSIKWEGGGQLPKELQGLFTSTMDAQRAIDIYEQNRKIKAERKVSTSSED